MVTTLPKVPEEELPSVVEELPPVEPLELYPLIARLYPRFPTLKPEELGIKMTELSTWAQEDPEAFLYDLDYRATPEERDFILRVIGVPEEYFVAREVTLEAIEAEEARITELVTTVFPDIKTPEELIDFATDNWNLFIMSIQEKGRSKETQDLLRLMGFEWEDIGKIFADKKVWMDVEGVRTLVTIDIEERGIPLVKDMRGRMIGEIDPETGDVIPYKYRIGDTWKHFSAGVGDVIVTAGGALKWLGAEGMGENLSEFGEFLQLQAPPDALGEFEWSFLYNPRFYATRVTRTLPFTLSLVPAMIAGKYAGLAVAGAIGLGKFGTFLLEVLGAVAFSRPMESALEAGGVYDRAIDKGLSEAEAREAATNTFVNNLKLVGLDAVQLAVAFAPLPAKTFTNLIARGLVRTAMVGGRLTITGLTEAGEEVYQEIIQRVALGEDVVWDAEMKEVASIGGIIGIGWGTAGEVWVSIQKRTIDSMTPEMKAKFDTNKAGFIEQGLTDEQAQLRALDEFAKTEEGQNIIENAIDMERIEAYEKEIKPKTEADKIVWEQTFNQMREEITPIPEEVPAVPEVEKVLGRDRYLSRIAYNESRQAWDVGIFLKETRVTGEVTYGTRTRRRFFNTREEAEAWVEDFMGKEQVVEPKPPAVPEAVRTLPLEEVSKLETRVPLNLIRKDESVEIARLTKEIQEEGITEPITIRVREDGSQIVWDGLHRLIVAQDLGIKNIPVQFIGDEGIAIKKPPTIPPSPAVEVAKPPVEPVTPVEVAPEGASGRVFKRIQIKPAETGITEKLRRGWHRFNVAMLDDLYAIKKFTREYTKGGLQLSIEENPYILARLLKGIHGKATGFLEYGTFGKTFWKTEKGKAVPNYTGESLEAILKDIKEVGDWQDFSTYLVARRSVELAGRNIKTGIDIADAKEAITELEAKYKNFPNLAERIYKYQDRLLVYANEMGLISKELLGKLRKYGDYVPFYRVMNELQAKGFMGKKMANITQPIKRIKGSEREIINPLESIVKNTYVLISAADRNRIGIAMANLVDKNPELADLFERVTTPMARVARVTAKEFGVEIEGLTDAEADQVVDIFRPSFFVRGDEVTVLIDGKKAYYRIDSDLRDALLNLDVESLGLMMRALSYPAKWLRAGAVLSPDFQARNPVRDAMTAFAYSNYGFLPGIDTLRGVASMLGKNKDLELFRLSGAERSMMVSIDRTILQKTFRELMGEKKFTEYLKHPLELMQLISEVGERATRLGEFKRGIARGAVPLKAGMSAREVTLDFAQAGTTSRSLNSIIAFFNANVRGWAWMISRFKDHPVRTSFKVFAGITLPSILLLLANREDERWKEIPEWEKNLFWIVFVGDKIYRIPKPFELGIIFGSVPERFVEWLFDRDPKLVKGALLQVLESGAPGYIPTALLPIIQTLTNYDFFRRRAIVPASREQMPPELQYTRWTTAFSRKLGELLKFSPAKIDSIIFNWTGGLGRYALDIADVILKGTGISPDIPEPSPTLKDTPVLRAFVVRNPYGFHSEGVRIFYDKLDEYTKGEKYLKEMIALDEWDKFEEYKAAHPELLFFYDFEEEISYSASARYLRRVARDLSELRKKQDEIYKDKIMSPEEKRRLIDETDILITEVARRALALFLGEIPDVLQHRLNEAINKLGEIEEDVPILSLEKPDIFNMRDLNREFGYSLEGVTTEELSKLEGIDPLAFAYLDKEKVEATVEPLPNKAIYKIEPELKEGVTFEDYFKQWQAGLIKDEALDNLTRKQRELLREYHTLTPSEQRAFRSEHPELTINPRSEWLKAHWKENAQLALWGLAPILSMEAYNEVKRLIDELDIPDNAMPEFTLPPENLVDAHFEYVDASVEFGATSWQAQLVKAKNIKYTEWAELEIPESPIEALELKVKHYDLFKEYDAYGDRDLALYVADSEERDEARDKLKADNQGWVDDIRRIEALENDGADFAEAWVDRGHIIDEFGAGSSEAILWLVDNMNVYDWAVSNDLLEDNRDENKDREPILRINVDYAKQDDEYNAIVFDDKRKQEARRKEYLLADVEYARARRRRDAYSIRHPDDYSKRFPDELIETYIDYYMIPGKPDDWLEGVAYYEEEWFFMEHEDLYNAMIDFGILKEKGAVLEGKEERWEKVPPRDIFKKWWVYNTLTTQYERDAYRLENPDLDEWGVSIGIWKITMSEKRRRLSISEREKFYEDIEEAARELEELLAELR